MKINITIRKTRFVQCIEAHSLAKICIKSIGTSEEAR